MKGPTSRARRQTPVRPGGLTPAAAARLVALYLQWCGRYDAATAAWFEYAWRRSRRASALRDWLRFRRELGQPPDRELAAMLYRMSGARQDDAACAAAELLLESGAPSDLASLQRLHPSAAFSPPIADRLVELGASVSPRARQLARFHRSQGRWRSEFADDLLSAGGTICVVGNGGSLVDAGLGDRIDAQARIIRFNHWKGPQSSSVDIGTRVDAWVCTPRVLRELDRPPAELPHWVVLSGPDARYRRAGRPVEWDLVLGMLDAGVKVLTFPLTSWRASVDATAAPPSAGLLFLGWVATVLGGFDRLAVAGFDIAGMDAKGYHHVDLRFRRGRRHDWDRERRLLGDWKNEGLRWLSEWN